MNDGKECYVREDMAIDGGRERDRESERKRERERGREVK